MTSAENRSPTNNTLKTNIFNERYLYRINRDTFSKLSATVIFDKAFKASLFNKDSLSIIIGTDSGLLPQYIYQQGIPSGSRYLFIEPEEILTELNQHHLIDPLDDKIIYSTYPQWQQLAEQLNLEQYAYIGTVQVFDAICTQNASLDEYAELSWQVNESLKTLCYQYSVRLSTEVFITKQLENVAEAQQPAVLFKQAFQGQTAIILAGGPSLTSQLEWVKQHRDNLVVLSVSRISKQLLQADILPDFIFSVDPFKISFEVSHDMLSFSPAPVLIHANHIYPELLSQWSGHHLYLDDRLPWKSALNSENLPSVGPTVTNCALLTAYHFGFERILLAGVDLCFTKNGITHAEGSAEQIAGAKYNTTSLQVKIYTGEYRSTGEDYFAALKSLEHIAQLITSEHKQVINLAETAAVAEYIRFQSPDSIQLQPLKKTVSEVIATQLPDYSLQQQREYYSLILRELNKAHHHMQGIARLANKANRLNSAMFNAEGLITNYQDKKQLDKLEKTINKQHHTYRKLVQNFGIRQFIKIDIPHDDKEWEAEHVQELGRLYYDAYESGTQQLSLLLTQAITRVESRLEEHQPNPDFPALIAQWQADRSYKRAQLWQATHNSSLTPHIQQQFVQLAQDFKSHVTAANQNLIVTMNADRSNIQALQHKAKILFRYQKLEELKNLKENFLKDSKNNDKQDYLALILAYIATLEKNNEVAIEYYHQIINTDATILIEEALYRIAQLSITLENHQNSFLALECLSQISPLYLPFYAESAHLLGQSAIAIDSYMAYIQLFPDDIASQLKLATLYIAYNSSDAAELMLDHILKQSPDLEAAQVLKQQLNHSA